MDVAANNLLYSFIFPLAQIDKVVVVAAAAA
jgi:hypothetical protein